MAEFISFFILCIYKICTWDVNKGNDDTYSVTSTNITPVTEGQLRG